MVDEVFGRFRLDERIGHGGMGEVFRAFDTRKQRTVAVKRLRAELAADAEFRARFRHESAIAARISAPHVIPIHDFGDVDGRLFIEMQLINGPDLTAWIAEHGPVPPATAVRIVGQVAEALEAAHADGLVHRDVKPSNVLLAGATHDFAYLVDFGLARSVNGDTTAHTAAGATVGTVAYMAPERFLEGAADHRSDVYSLACLLHEALTGQQPFTADDLPSMMYAHLTLAPPRPSLQRPGVPAALDAVVARGMAKKPEDRYPTAAALAVAAVAALAGPGVVSDAGPEADTVVRSVPQAAGRSHRRWTLRTRIAAGGAALAAAAVAVAAILQLPMLGAAPPAAALATSPVPTIAATLNVGSNPGPPTVSPDGRTVYVVTDNGVSSIDIRTSLVRTYELAPRSRGLGTTGLADLALSPSGGLLYVTATAPGGGSEVIAVFDTVTGANRQPLPLGPRGAVASDLTLSPDGRTISAAIFVPDGPAATARYTVIDTGTGAVLRSFPLFVGYAQALIVAPGTHGYVLGTDQALGRGSIAPIDVVAGTVGAPLPVGDNPCTQLSSRDGTTAYVSVASGVAVIDTAIDAVERSIPVPRQPCGMVLAPDERSLWFTTAEGISVIDIPSGVVGERLRHVFPGKTGHVAISPEGRRAFVNDPAAATVLVIDIPAGS